MGQDMRRLRRRKHVDVDAAKGRVRRTGYLLAPAELDIPLALAARQHADRQPVAAARCSARRSAATQPANSRARSSSTWLVPCVATRSAANSDTATIVIATSTST